MVRCSILARLAGWRPGCGPGRGDTSGMNPVSRPLSSGAPGADTAGRVSVAPPHPGGRLPLILLALWLLLAAPWRPLLLPDEGRYVGVAWEMLGSGDWLTPTLDGLPYFHKPPLMYWITAAAMRLAGPVPLAMRAAPLVGAMLMALALWIWTAAPVWGAQRERLRVTALALLGSMPFFVLGSQYANHDMLVAGCVSLAVVLARRALDEEHVPLRWVTGAWVAAALAVLAKGLIGVVLPALVLLPWVLLRADRGRALARLLHPAGLLAFALAGLPWFLAMQHLHPDFFDYFILEQHFRRYTQSNFNNRLPFWFYPVVLPLLTLPASLLLPAALRRLGRASRAAADASGPATALRHELWLALWWVVAVTGFFSLPKSKLVGYVLPTLAPWAVLLATAWVAQPLRRLRLAVGGGVLLCVLAVAGLTWKGPANHADLAAALAARLQPGDRVAYLGDAFFDLRLLAHASLAPAVIDDWEDPEIARGDSWRKELRDTVRFAPALGASRLWARDEAWRQRCAGGRLWLVRSPGAALPPGFEDARSVTVGRCGELMQVEGPAPARRCEAGAQVPAGSPPSISSPIR